MKKFLADGGSLNQWCRFEHNYNVGCAAAETPHMLALLYAAILSFDQSIEEQKISQLFTHFWEDSLIPHDRRMWYDLLTLKRHTRIETPINLMPNVNTDGSSVMDKFVALAKFCDYTLTNYEMKSSTTSQRQETPLKPTLNPQADWLNQTTTQVGTAQSSLDGAGSARSSSVGEAATSPGPMTKTATILANAINNHLPLFSFFVVAIIALTLGFFSETKVSAPKQIKQD